MHSSPVWIWFVNGTQTTCIYNTKCNQNCLKKISPYMHTCTMHALWAKAYHLLVCECVRRPVFVCAWHLTTIHRSICCGSFHRLCLLSDGGSDAGLISCSLTAPACSWVEPARSCGNFSSSVATFFFSKEQLRYEGQRAYLFHNDFSIFGIKSNITLQHIL